MPLDAKKRETFGEGKTSFCGACSFGSLDPLPPEEVVASSYELDSYYTQGESHLPDLTPSLADRFLIKLVHLFDRGEQMTPEQLAEMVPDRERALDVGSGGGEVARSFARLGFQAYGVEPDPKSVSRTTGDRIQVFEGFAEDLPEEISKLRFDAVSMTHVLEHCRDPRAAIAGARSVLEPGGLFWCEVPNSACRHFREINVASEMYDAPRHLHFFDDASLQKVVIEGGFEVVRVYFHGFTRHHLPGWRAWETGLADLVRASRPDIHVKRHTMARSFGLALRTILAAPRQKYDCVGVVARAV